MEAVRRGRRRPSMYGRPRPTRPTVLPTRRRTGGSCRGRKWFREILEVDEVRVHGSDSLEALLDLVHGIAQRVVSGPVLDTAHFQKLMALPATRITGSARIPVWRP